MHSEYTTILKLIPRASKRVNDGHAVLRPDDASRDVLHTPRFVGSRRARRWLTRYFRPRRMHQGDRGYLHSEIAANPVQGSSTVTGSHEGEGGAWRFLIFSSDSRRPDIPRQDSLTRGSGRPIENERTAMVRICRPDLLHPFLPRRRCKQPVDFWPTKTGLPRQRRRRADGRNDRFWQIALKKSFSGEERKF